MKIKEVLPLMGKVVTVRERLCHLTVGDRRLWRAYPYPKPRAGWVVGFRYLKEGELHYGGDYAFESYLTDFKIIPCLEVCFWPTMKPVHVPLDGFTLGGVPLSPSAWIVPREWTEKTREALRREMESFPRDNRGRFLREEVRRGL